MSKPYALLTLYDGFISSRGLPEGRFNPANTALIELQRLSEALKEVKMAIEMYHTGSTLNKFVYSIEYGWCPFVRNEGEAKKLTTQLLCAYPCAHEQITVHTIMHGHLCFSRQLKCNTMNPQDKTDLVERVNATGIGPIRYRQEKDGMQKEELAWIKNLTFI